MARHGMAGHGGARLGKARQTLLLLRGMRMNMFKPKGEKPYWEMIFDYLVDKPVDMVITYAELSKVIGQDIEDNRSSVYKARKRLLEETDHYLVVVRDVGYKIIEGMSIMKISKGRQLSAGRQIKTADFETSNIDTKKLSPEDKKKLQDFMTKNNSIRLAFKGTQRALEIGIEATREHIVGAEAQMASAQVTQLFTEKQLEKLKELIGE